VIDHVPTPRPQATETTERKSARRTNPWRSFCEESSTGTGRFFRNPKGPRDDMRLASRELCRGKDKQLTSGTTEWPAGSITPRCRDDETSTRSEQ
jgi:hypothetical protein